MAELKRYMYRKATALALASKVDTRVQKNGLNAGNRENKRNERLG